MAGATKTVYIVPHTHWDREWYEPFEIFRAQLVTLWDQLLSLTESDPDFRFLMDGQSVVIDDYLEIRPEARDRLERAVRRGQIQLGPWYTLPDEFLVTGETLVRNLERGIASADAHGGSMRVGYLPDTFGHAAQMPQIYHQLGFQHAAIWRGVPLSIDRVAFVWKAPDGSAVLTAYMGNSYSHGVKLPTEAEALRSRIMGAMKAIEPFQPTNDILLMNGNDHELPQAALSAAVREASAHPNGTIMRLARLDDYLAKLPAEGWPTWEGELRSSARANVLMGTLSVRVPDKQLYAQASRTLERLAEPLAALSGAHVGTELKEAWTQVLQNAAHDTACGSGIDAVAEASRHRSRSALAIGDRIIDRCLPLVASAGEVWNPSPFARQAVIDVDGTPSLTQLVPGFSVAPLVPTAPRVAVQARERTLENAFLLIELSNDGTLRVLDKRQGLSYPALHRLVDEGDAGDEYNFSPVEEPRRGLEAIAFESRLTETWPVRAGIEATFAIEVPSGLNRDRCSRTNTRVRLPVRLRLTLEADSPRLGIALTVDNRASDHRLRLHFRVPFVPANSAADTPFHVTRRPLVMARRDPGAPEVELPTFPMRSFVDVSDGQTGMALITDGLHEYEVLPTTNELALTLLRAVGWLSRDDLKTRTGHAGPALETPGAQVLGQHEFHYSLYFHAGAWNTGTVWRAAEAALLPLQPGRDQRSAAVKPVIELEPDCVQITACIPTEDGYHLRILNASDDSTDGTVRLEPAPRSASLTTVGRTSSERLRINQGLRLRLRPWQIATLAIVR